jgi:hypothetical protein
MDQLPVSANLGPREPLPCPHEDCVYRDGIVNNRRYVFLRINDDDAIAMVDAVENAHPHRVAMIIKRQPWYPSIAKELKEVTRK